MYFLIDHDSNKIVNEYHCKTERYKVHQSKNSVTTSEGMTNHSSSCWMISVLQALRASPSFRLLYAPQPGQSNTLKRELFHLFDVVEGRNGEKKRRATEVETRQFRNLLRQYGLPIKDDRGYLEEPFLQFLLKQLGATKVEYLSHASRRENRELIMNLPLQETKEPRQLQTIMQERKISFSSLQKVPEFLPIYLNRPRVHREASRVPLIPSPILILPAGSEGKKAQYRLVSVVVGRDTHSHAYCYTIERDAAGNMVWVEYNDSNVIIHNKFDTEKRRSTSNQTPFQDACRHALILIYQFVGYASA